MICKPLKYAIVVSDKGDVSTNKVIAFLNAFVYEVVKLSQDICIDNISIVSNCLSINRHHGIVFSTNHANASFWYRRSDFNCSLKIEGRHKNYEDQEWKVVKDILHQLEKSVSLGSYEKEINNNLFLDLTIASNVGLCTPKTLITTKKSSVIDFSKNHIEIISKPLNIHPYVVTKETYFSSNGTFVVESSTIDKLSDSFFPTLFQEYIEKSYEVRVFYLKGKIYSMAIFSQLDEKTKTDYRNYNRAKPNRNVPYQLPLEIEEKIRLLMDKSGLDTGSLDIIRATDGRFVFLEVNPCGQFDWLSGNCNYYLEQKIANYLAYGTID